MSKLQKLLDNNLQWAERINKENSDFFSKMAQQQNPEYLWIGCSDSRVHANVIVDLLPGEVFVHRNIANLVIHTDINCLSVMQFAVDVLKVKHIIVCGHYNCGGIKATMDQSHYGLTDYWLRHVHDIYRKHEHFLSNLSDEQSRYDRLCELNAIEQVANICQTGILKDAWLRGQNLSVHGWIYQLNNGHLRDLRCTVSLGDNSESIINAAIQKVIND